jgi:hypothetical protein
MAASVHPVETRIDYQGGMWIHRFLVAPAIVAAILAAPALAAQDPAAITYAQRRALLAADDGCALLDAAPRAALTAMTHQSRATLVRAGWTRDRLDVLERQAISAGRSHLCASDALRDAAASARAGYEGWRRLPSMTFPGTDAEWRARRTPDPTGWYVWQDVAGAPGYRFGVRGGQSGPELAISGPDASRAAIARLRLRDVTRAPQPGFDAPGRLNARLTDRLPMPTESRLVIASARRDAGFAFAPAALDAIAGLDPREAVAIELAGADGVPRRYVIEVGDIAAARAFLALR